MSKTQTTPFEEGDSDAPLLVLGQAPARQEIRSGKPLAGPSGQVFNECLHSAGLSRRECYIVNVWEEEVITDKRTNAITLANGGHLLWTKKGFTEYGLELAVPAMRRIRASGSNCVLALGQQALELCTHKHDKIMKWRGSILQGSHRIGNKKIIATVHPAATIYGTYLWRYLIMSDMKKAKRESNFPEVMLPERHIIIRPTMQMIRDYFQYVKDMGRAASDIEAINHQVSCFCLAPTTSEALVVPFVDAEGDVWTEEEEMEIWRMYADFMGNPDIEKVNQNLIGFDAPFLLTQNFIHARGTLRDHMIAQSVLYPEFNKGLDFQASIHTDEPYWKDEGKMWKDAGGDYPVFWRYNGKDGCVSLECWDVLAAELTQRDMWDTYLRHERLAHVLMFMTVKGFRVNRELLDETKLDIQGEIDARTGELNNVADFEFNPNSSAQCAKYFYDHKGLTPYRNAGGGVTTDDKAMSRIFRKTGLREAKLVQELRNLKKLKGTYLDVQTDADGRIRCSWNPRGTWTGRLSSSKTIKGTGLNFANLDPRFKGFMIPDEDQQEKADA